MSKRSSSEMSKKSILSKKTHNRDYFFKYVSTRAVVPILEKLQVRWSSPVTFNDPFDTQVNLNLNFNEEQYLEGVWQEVKNIISNDIDPEFDMNSQFGPFFQQIRQERQDIIEGWESKEVEIKKTFLNGENNLRSMQEAMNQVWKKTLPNLFIFCISEIEDDLLMWAHYAESHQGGVIKLNCLPSLDSALCIAKPVEYRPDIPFLAELNEYIKHVTGQKPINLVERFLDLAYIKSDHWKYEKEWRVVNFKPELNNGLGYVLETLWPDEVNSVYLGYKMNEELRSQIKGIIRDNPKLSHVKIFQGSLNGSSFKLDFERID